MIARPDIEMEWKGMVVSLKTVVLSKSDFESPYFHLKLLLDHRTLGDHQILYILYWQLNTAVFAYLKPKTVQGKKWKYLVETMEEVAWTVVHDHSKSGKEFMFALLDKCTRESKRKKNNCPSFSSSPIAPMAVSRTCSTYQDDNSNYSFAVNFCRYVSPCQQ